VTGIVGANRSLATGAGASTGGDGRSLHSILAGLVSTRSWAPAMAPRAARAEATALAPTLSRAPRIRIRWRSLALIFGAWTLVGIIGSVQTFLGLLRSGADAEFWRVMTAHMISMWLWAAFTPPMVALARRFRVDRDTWASTVPLHVLFALGFAVLDVVGTRLLLPWSYAGAPPTPSAGTMFVRQLFVNVASYLTVAAITYAIDYARMYREREVAAAHLAEQLARAQLLALQTQLRPHFLFNALNTIAEQVYTDPAGADRMLTRLGALLRTSFTTAERPELTLREELDLVRHYVEIMQVRFRDRVHVEIDADPDALDETVPTLVLQPLVENALRHGVEPLEEGGQVEIVCRRRYDRLVLEVRDNGRGLPAEGVREGVGTRNTRERLAQRYGSTASFALRPRVQGGVIAAVNIPCRPLA
jgi:signal transduction histidine kinase